MKSGDLMKLAIVAVVGYVGYQYLVSSGLWAQWFSGAAPALPAGAATGVLPTTQGTLLQLPAPVTTSVPVVQSATAQQLQSYANLDSNSSGGLMTMDHWIYYWQAITGKTLTGMQVLTVMAALGINSETRGTMIPVGRFLTAMSSSGLSGIVQVPGTGPISAPLPTTQNFRGGYGGYAGGGYRSRLVN